MTLTQSLFIIALLIAASAFFAVAEISLAASRRLRLRQMADEDDPRADKALRMQEQPGDYFTVVQVGQNGIAILGGIVGEGALSGTLGSLLTLWLPESTASSLGFVLSFLVITSLFILFADLMPKRLAMIAPERIAVAVIRPVLIFIRICKPLSWALNLLANLIFRIFKVDTTREDSITFDEISAAVEAGAQAGVLQKQEQHFIENVFELESRSVASAMTNRDHVVYFTLTETEESIRQKIARHSKFPVCDGTIDRVIGYVDTRDILVRLLNKQSLFQLNESSIRTVLIIPDTLTLSELLDKFRATKETFAVVINEYALVMGVITLSDIMLTVMGSWGSPLDQDDQILQRDDGSWLIDGSTPVGDVKRTLGLESLPDEENYETAAGFMMYMLRKVPKRTDSVEYQGVKFEVLDVDHYRIDQLLVRHLPPGDAEQGGQSGTGAG